MVLGVGGANSALEQRGAHLKAFPDYNFHLAAAAASSSASSFPALSLLHPSLLTQSVLSAQLEARTGSAVRKMNTIRVPWIVARSPPSLCVCRPAMGT